MQAACLQIHLFKKKKESHIVWAHWHSCNEHLSYPGSGSYALSSWVSSGGLLGGGCSGWWLDGGWASCFYTEPRRAHRWGGCSGTASSYSVLCLLIGFLSCQHFPRTLTYSLLTHWTALAPPGDPRSASAPRCWAAGRPGTQGLVSP